LNTNSNKGEDDQIDNSDVVSEENIASLIVLSNCTRVEAIEALMISNSVESAYWHIIGIDDLNFG